MPAYDINFINELSKTMTSNKLNSDVENYLNNILLDIKKPVYNIVPNFASNSFNKNQKNKNMRNYKNSRRSFHRDELDKDFNEKIRLDKEAINNYKINRIKDINNKSEHDMVVINIRKILNKITDQNYDKLKNEILCYYKSIFDDKKNLDKIDLNKINIFIFDSLVYNNIIFNNLYSDLLYNLININSEFSDILNNYLEIFYNVYKFIKIPKSTYSYDEITEINKHNDKYKCLCRFYIFCFKVNLIPSEIINDATSNLQQELLENIKLEEKKEYNELLTQFIFLICSNFKFIDEKLIENFKYISNLKNNSYPSISNKIIFKHKDIVEKNL